MIVLVNSAAPTAKFLKELIEFMDAPRVITATPVDWRQQVQDERLEAVFIGPELAGEGVHDVIEGVGELDPNVPIVVLARRQTG